jgi:hypothetical protein
MSGARNVLGGPLAACGLSPLTGFARDGHCHTGAEDVGSHTVCAQMTHTFLRYAQSRGNDLVTPVPEFGFPGLQVGDRWCVCASRWLEAAEDGVAPPVELEATTSGRWRTSRLPIWRITRCAIAIRTPTPPANPGRECCA